MSYSVTLLQGSDVSLICVSSPFWATLQFYLNPNLVCIEENREYPIVPHKYSNLLHQQMKLVDTMDSCVVSIDG